jgi:hypothetical protein
LAPQFYGNDCANNMKEREGNGKMKGVKEGRKNKVKLKE